LKFEIFTIFPSIFDGFLNESIIKRARERGLIAVDLHDIRDWTTDRHRSVDDYPYGGGAGMVMMAPPIVEAVESTIPERADETEIILLSASGERFTQAIALDLAQNRSKIALICGRYEGVDQRAIDILGAREISIGDYVLTGGELPAAVIVDAVSRLVPGVIQEASIAEESHTTGLLEYPQYTRPFEYRGLTPPEVLLSGHHARIEAWRTEQALLRTQERRPDLLRDTESTAECNDSVNETDPVRSDSSN
jgi:tRNA (guanine37-N1)-methyltransferase